MANLCAIVSFTGTSNVNLKLAEKADWLFLANKSGATLTFTVKSESGTGIIEDFVLQSGDSFDCRIKQFTQIEIKSNGFFQIVCSKYVN